MSDPDGLRAGVEKSVVQEAEALAGGCRKYELRRRENAGSGMELCANCGNWRWRHVLADVLAEQHRLEAENRSLRESLDGCMSGFEVPPERFWADFNAALKALEDSDA